METYATVRGLKRYLLPVRLLTPRLSSYWVRLVTPFSVSLAPSNRGIAQRSDSPRRCSPGNISRGTIVGLQNGSGGSTRRWRSKANCQLAWKVGDSIQPATVGKHAHGGRYDPGTAPKMGECICREGLLNHCPNGRRKGLARTELGLAAARMDRWDPWGHGHA
jgi:hypothetical protein